MKIICYFNKNLKMSEGKLASQVGHVCKELGKIISFEYGPHVDSRKDTIVVLGLRANKFKEKYEEVKSNSFFKEQKDLGFTEVESGTMTTFGYIEQ